MLQNAKPLPLAVYSSVIKKISLAVQTSSKSSCTVFQQACLHATPVVLFVGGSGGGDGKGRRVCVMHRAPPAPVLRPSLVDEGQPARTFVPHPAAVSLHPRVGRHLHLHLLLLVLPVHLRRQRAVSQIQTYSETGPWTYWSNSITFHWNCTRLKASDASVIRYDDYRYTFRWMVMISLTQWVLFAY